MRQRFNLLPHREMGRAWARQVLIRQLATAMGIGVVLAVLFQLLLEQDIRYWQSYNRTLAGVLHDMAPNAQRAEMLQRQRADMLQKRQLMETLDARRTVSVLILNDIARSVPRGVYLERLEEDGADFRLEGRAHDNAVVAHLFEAMLRSRQLSGLTLEEIRLDEGSAGLSYRFAMTGRVDLSATLRQPPATDAEGDAP